MNAAIKDILDPSQSLLTAIIGWDHKNMIASYLVFKEQKLRTQGSISGTKFGQRVFEIFFYFVAGQNFFDPLSPDRSFSGLLSVPAE